jgi:hypothetical protein
LQHDFLWRTTRELPERGRIGIFNRSYYEEVLIVRVHREIRRGEGLPGAPRDDKAVWLERYRSIANLERHLHDNGTRTPAQLFGTLADVVGRVTACGMPRKTGMASRDLRGFTAQKC